MESKRRFSDIMVINLTKNDNERDIVDDESVRTPFRFSKETWLRCQKQT